MRGVSIILVVQMDKWPLLIFSNHSAIIRLSLICMISVLNEVDGGTEWIFFLLSWIGVGQIGLLVVEDGCSDCHSISSALPQAQLHSLARLLLVVGLSLL